ncbi:GPW/gp25 family protein [Morganella morganii]|uniref:GPW/gp25 family protein n=1 Tax=Morganella morganii TaxID=582 RepID=UPI0021CF57FF|nr:GPW/gp25 family protein [Morganella morganii]MCU6213259.1 GPW/gp25 family protein [Morganella morganii]
MKYYGFNALTGRGITDIEHVRQSVRDILITPVGSRIARRTYGSLLFRLTDQPDNKAVRLQLMSACYSALLRWEPRIQIQQLTISSPEPASIVIDLSGVYAGTGQPFSFSVPVR